MTLRSPDGAFERRSPETLGLDPERPGAVDYATVNDTPAEQIRFALGNREAWDESEGEPRADYPVVDGFLEHLIAAVE